ncbi:MAG TPA: FAD-dependent oxidoreductase [Xanthobacteraceae bacterium]|nr:FAD-dependent oxidoreductase [Xanthobacteraceae bacterium]
MAYALTRQADRGLDRSAVAALRKLLRGPLLQPAEPGYDEARTIWNAMITKRPALIARVSGDADVIACVNFARENGLPLSVRGGGHNVAGTALCDGGLMIDMSLRRGVRVDPTRRIVRVKAAPPGATSITRRSRSVWWFRAGSCPIPASGVSPWAAASAGPRASSATRRTT